MEWEAKVSLGIVIIGMEWEAKVRLGIVIIGMEWEAKVSLGIVIIGMEWEAKVSLDIGGWSMLCIATPGSKNISVFCIPFPLLHL